MVPIKAVRATTRNVTRDNLRVRYPKVLLRGHPLRAKRKMALLLPTWGDRH
jgi:hypothetical protein